MNKKRLGLIGVGGIMNGPHIEGYLKCPDCEITAICDINPEALKKTGDRLGIPEEMRFLRHQDLLKCGRIDAVDIATSPDAHVPIALDALDAGFPVSVEKPIGMDFTESAALARKSAETGLPVFICFSWRYISYPRYMKKLINDGCIGRLQHLYIKYTKDSGLWKGRKLEWRFQKERGGSGVLSDLGSHMFDFVRFVGEDYKAVYCSKGVTVKRRQYPDSSEWGDVTTDDWCDIICKLQSGINATISLSRADCTHQGFTEVHAIGERGSIRYRWDPEQAESNILECCMGDDLKTRTFRLLDIPDGYADAFQSRSFLDLLDGKTSEFTSTIESGLTSQAAVDAALLSSELGREISMEELYAGVGLTFVPAGIPEKDFDINLENAKIERGEAE